MIEISESLIWSKTLMELIFNPCGEFRRAHLVKSTLTSLVDVPGIFSDLLRSVGCGKQRKAVAHIQSLVKIAALVPEFAVEDLPSAELQPRLLRLQ